MIRSICYNGLKVVLILFFTTFIPFLLLNSLSNNPAEVALRIRQITPTEQNIALERHELGLDHPFFVRYVDWIVHALKGDFGTSYATGKSISSMILQAFPYTLILTGITLLFILITCLLLGILSARFENHWTEKGLRIALFILNAMPSFWLGLLLISFFSVKLDWFPTGGYSGFLSIILPAITLSVVYSSSYVRLIRNELIKNKELPYIQYYQARGFSKNKITKHLLKNSLRTSIVSIGISIPKLIVGSAIIESIFSWPGLGFLGVTAIHNRDIPLLQAYIVMMSLFFIFSSFLIDEVNNLIDPRLRAR